MVDWWKSAVWYSSVTQGKPRTLLTKGPGYGVSLLRAYGDAAASETSKRLRKLFAIDENATGDIAVAFFPIDQTNSVVLAKEDELGFKAQDADEDPRDADLGRLVFISAAESAEDVFTPAIERSRERPILAGEVRCSPCVEFLATCQTYGRDVQFKGASWFAHDSVPFFDGTRVEKTGQRIFVVLLQKHDEIPYGAGRKNHMPHVGHLPHVGHMPHVGHLPHVGHMRLDDFSTMFGSKRCCE